MTHNGEVISYVKNVRNGPTLIATWDWWELPAKFVRDNKLFTTENCDLSINIGGEGVTFHNQHTMPHARGTRLYVGVVIGAKVSSLCREMNAKEITVQLHMRNRTEAFQRQVSLFLASDKVRQTAIAKAARLPKRRLITVAVYDRDPAIVAGALVRAADVCEGCGQPAPFRRRSDGRMYLEVHHIKSLAEGGEDTLENVIALCPNCHRRAHFGTVVPS